MAIFYHGTSERTAELIERDGFIGSPAVNLNGSNLEGEYTFFADNEKHANAYGEAVIKVWLPDDIEVIRWEGYGPFGDDEIIVATDKVNEYGQIDEIMYLGDKYHGELGY